MFRGPRKRILPLILSAFAALAGPARGADPIPSVDFKKVVNLTPEETMARSKSYYGSMLATDKHIAALSDTAKKQKDMVKLFCVEDKRTQVKGHIAVADKSMQLLNIALSRSDELGRQHEFTRISILYQKVLVLSTEAGNCIGEDVSYVGDTKVEVEIDPTIPTTDPTAQPLPTPDVVRPPEASPFV